MSADRMNQDGTVTRETLFAMLRSVNNTDRCDALLALALHDEYENAVSVVLAHVHDPVLRHLAVLCLGHIARLHRRISAEAVAIVTAALSDPDELVRGQADSAASDIRMFARASLRDDDPSWKQWPDESGEFTFRTRFTYEELDELPGGRDSIRYVPGDRAGGQDGVLIRFQPEHGDAWLGMFAFGNVASAALTQVLGMPDGRKLCVIARGAGYIANADDANDWELVRATPVVDVRVVPTERLVVFASHTDLIAYGEHGVAWRTKRLAWDGFTIVSIDGRTLCGELREVRTDTMRQFVVDLRTGHASHDLETPDPALTPLRAAPQLVETRGGYWLREELPLRGRLRSMKDTLTTLESVFGAFRPQDGVSDEELLRADGALGRPLPAAMRTFYSTIGRHAMHRHSLMVPLEDLETHDDIVVICDEQQNVTDWAVRLQDFGHDDPKVFCRCVDRQGDTVYVEEFESFSQFTAFMAASAAQEGALPHVGLIIELPASSSAITTCNSMGALLASTTAAQVRVDRGAILKTETTGFLAVASADATAFARVATALGFEDDDWSYLESRDGFRAPHLK